jgi:hypothetical protein
VVLSDGTVIDVLETVVHADEAEELLAFARQVSADDVDWRPVPKVDDGLTSVIAFMGVPVVDERTGC